MAQTNEAKVVKNVVLVHGGFVDQRGSYKSLIRALKEALKKNGYDVTIVQNSTASLAGDVATTKVMTAPPYECPTKLNFPK